MPASTFTKQTYAQQLAQQLETLIRTGQWRAGERTPSIRQLAQQYAVSPRTVLQAFQKLEQQQWVTRNPAGRLIVQAPPADATDHTLPSEAGSAPPENPRKVPRQGMHIGMLGLSAATDLFQRDEWIGRIALGADRELSETGGLCSSRIFSNNLDPGHNIHETMAQVEQLASQLSGAILFPRQQPHLKAEIALCDRLGIPWVSINRPEHVVHNFVATDNNGCGRIAGQCFLAQSMDRIVILTAASSWQASWRAKAIGVYEAFVIAGHPTTGITCLECEDHLQPLGYQAMHQYLEHHAPPQAIFGVGDALCLGAMQACQERGIAVPDQVAILGSTGSELAAAATPAMTVVAQPMDEIGRTAVRMLIRMIQAGKRRLPGKLLPSHLILRQSLTLLPKQQQALIDQGVTIETPFVG